MIVIGILALATMPTPNYASVIYLGYSLQEAETTPRFLGNSSFISATPTFPVSDTNSVQDNPSPTGGPELIIASQTISIADSSAAANLSLQHTEVLNTLTSSSVNEQFSVTFAIDHDSTFSFTNSWNGIDQALFSSMQVTLTDFVNAAIPVVIFSDTSPTNHTGMLGGSVYIPGQFFAGHLYLLQANFTLVGLGPLNSGPDPFTGMGEFNLRINAVPEPSSMSLMGFGTIAIAIAAWRRDRSHPTNLAAR